MNRNKHKDQIRLYAFIFITMMALYGYQLYYNYQNDRYTDRVLQVHNERTVVYVKKNIELSSQNRKLQHDLNHAKKENQSLVEQIEVINQYWKEKYTEVLKSKK